MSRTHRRLAATVTVAALLTSTASTALAADENEGNVDATFTPRAAPGPCITLAGETAIDFGTVELGARVEATGLTFVNNCSDIGQVVRAKVSDATAGASSMVPIRSAVAGPNQFNYLISEEDISVDLGAFGPYTPLDGTDTQVRVFIADGGIPGYSFRHRLIVGAGSTTGLGEQFSATVTFTAMAAP